jgi:hypothetical protein
VWTSFFFVIVAGCDWRVVAGVTIVPSEPLEGPLIPYHILVMEKNKRSGIANAISINLREDDSSED